MSSRLREGALTDLSPMTLRVLHELELEHRENGRWPVDVRTLAARTGLRSSASVHHHLALLTAVRLVERGPGKFDGWRPRRRRG